jgi:phenylacetate-coenzyme A ligase PaaK-like adenylate-forming protein
LNINNIIDKIFDINLNFEEIAFEIFNFQYSNNIVYQQYINYLGIDKANINSIDKIPFLPIEFFKKHKIISYPKDEHFDTIFKSSGTTQEETSSHYIKSLNIYTKSFTKGFEYFYGSLKDYCIIVLFPNYTERKNSSLIYMLEHLIKESQNPDSGFFVKQDFSILFSKLLELERKGQKNILFGLSYALMDFAETYSKASYKNNFNNIIIMETGGMKGKRKEITKEEMHSFLKKTLKTNAIHSEYSMTELLSQTYAQDNRKFFCPPWMKILIRDIYDPLSIIPKNKTGGINIIDLANIFSCSFIATDDMGILNDDDNSFQIKGRIDNSQIRGCNLLL